MVEQEKKAEVKKSHKDYVSIGTIGISGERGKRTSVLAGENIPEHLVHLLDHWIDRGLVMLKSEWEKVKEAEKEKEKKAKPALKR
jgi:hypothetical protein